MEDRERYQACGDEPPVIERDGFNGPITFCCDNCGELDETRCAEFSGAMAKAKSHGWRARKADDDWQHYCKDCAR